MKVKSFALLVFVLFASCQSSKIESETYLKIQHKGSEVSNIAQAALLANVGQAIQKGGPEYAVEFCNLKANSIIDSLNNINQCSISRISAKNRNAENGLGITQEKQLWTVFESKPVADTIVSINGSLVYYKPIRIALPACLKCHGDPETDINQATQEKLRKLYPNDLATGYKLNDFRGLWKIEFEME